MASGGGALYGAEVLLVGEDGEATMAMAAALAEAGGMVTIADSVEVARRTLAEAGQGFDAAAIVAALGDHELAELVTEIRRHPRPCHHVLVGAPGRFANLGEVLASGAFEVLMVPVSNAELVDAVRRACAQTSVQRARWSPNRRPRLAPPLAEPTSVAPRLGVSGVVDQVASGSGLSDRERIVLQYIARGYRYEEIGRELSISTRTVKSYASSLKRKVGAGSRWDLLRKMFAA